MLKTTLSRKELIELAMGVHKVDDFKLTRVTGITLGEDKNLFDAYWEERPLQTMPLPNLIIVPDDAILELLVAFNASPIAPSPITALCRILTRKEAAGLFQSSLLDPPQDVSVSILSLAIAEAVILADGRLNARQVTPAMCKRTLSYTWGKATMAKLPPWLMETLPQRWSDTYAGLNATVSQNVLRKLIANLMGPLGVCAYLAMGLKPIGLLGELAYSTLYKDSAQQQHIWQHLSIPLGQPWPLQEIAAAPREERGLYLRSALKVISRASSDYQDESAAACAFLATQVAPGSLEHLELLRMEGNPTIVFWYVLFAALQAPFSVLQELSGVGHRVLRELYTVPTPAERPTADISFAELRILERAGIELIAKRFGHTGEVEVELAPYVTSSFSFHARNRVRSESEQMSIVSEQVASSQMPPKIRMQQLLSLMNDLVRDLPENTVPEAGNHKKTRSISKHQRSDYER